MVNEIWDIYNLSVYIGESYLLCSLLITHLVGLTRKYISGNGTF